MNDEEQKADTDPAPAEERPNYDHTCSRCQFLGEAEFEGRTYDLYFCEMGHLSPTVLARGSSAPHDYTSGLQLAQADPVLREAVVRAIEKDIITLDRVHALIERIDRE